MGMILQIQRRNWSEDRRGWGRGEKLKGINKYKLPIINSHRDIKDSTENVVDNIVIVLYRAW